MAIPALEEPSGVDEIPVVAPDFAPNLEQIVATRPDLIIAMAFQTEEPYWDDRNAITPSPPTTLFDQAHQNEGAPVLTLTADRPDQVTDDATRREFLTMLAAAGLLTACGGDGADQGAPAAEAELRTITHPGGTSEVPVRPQRVVTLQVALDGHLASVGLVPVGAIEGVLEWLAPYQELLPPGTDLGGISTKIGSSDGPNFEAIASLRPDLILAELGSEEFYDELAKIAPTVLVDRPSNADWKEAFDQAVDAVGRSDEAEEVRRRYRAQVDEAARRTGSVSVSFIRGSGPGLFRVDGVGAFAGTVAAEAGITVADLPPGEGEETDFGFIEFSSERLDVVTGDFIVTIDEPDGGASSIAELERSPLWASLPAVRAGRVLRLDTSVYNGGTYVAAELLLDALVEGVQ